MRPYLLSLISAAVFATSGAAKGAVISVNFNDSASPADDTYVTGPAGVEIASNWNNVVPVGKSGTFTTVALNDSTGSASGATLSVLKSASSTNITSTSDATLTTQDDRLMKVGTIVQNGASVAQFTVSGLSSAYTTGGYTVYVYVPGLANAVAAPSRFTITLTPNSVTANNQLAYTYDTNNTWGDSFMLGSTSSSTTTESNYVVFSGLTVDNFKVQVTDSTNTNGVLAGVQIVSVSSATVSVAPASGTTRNPSNPIDITASGGTYDITSSTVPANGFSVTGIANAVGTTGNKTGTVNFTAAGKLNGDYSSSFAFTIANAAAGNATYTYPLATTVAGNTGNQTSTLIAGTDFGNLTNKLSGTSDKAFGSVATLLDGTLSANSTIVMTWRNRAANEIFPGTGGPFLTTPAGLFSDVVDLSGITAGDIFVLQMTYSEAAFNAGGLNESDAALGYLDGIWKNAVAGNTAGPLNLAKEFNAFSDLGTSGLTDDLGRWGVDTATNTVWAVINHNSEFAVIPEPASLGVIALGFLALFGRRKR